ncbi:hypothetical protein H8356DRAFT_1710669 [Neocallimastix lanati (nom. inval.)]|uniref:Uncharacterized protein n=1 Tax=Neocallimastix californiae TaxID=1754190 RepID=A0A1Y2AQ35_9FUNG|nr:hypothetical protein H8356DRAFT_1710669 [Neocallimastix sp. JGI-2020a]ORY24327.1 hypothetical protein LY90DRAFT_706591 [Neocallimastix californiae]|eukprot:ORY24327.1 hypothetical protein LY90DRAFT_706591 [Neocallimastix californiae]
MALSEHLNYSDDLYLMNKYINHTKNAKNAWSAKNAEDNKKNKLSIGNHVQKLHRNIKKYYYEHDLEKRISKTFEDVYLL